MITKQQLTPVCHDLFAKVKANLPLEIAERLRCSRAVRNHGSYQTFLMFNIWDHHQADALTKDHCCYGLRYDPLRLRPGSTPWHLLLWINNIRIYQNQSAIHHVLHTDLRKICPPPFLFSVEERYVQLKWNFDWNGPLSGLAAFLAPNATKLIAAAHPVLMPIFDSFTQPLDKEERRKIILAREKKYFGPATRPDPITIREYTRSIPPSWRPEILARHKHKCAHCGMDLIGKTVHMDHILPFSKGGKTTKENLQPLCSDCNLKKGNRSDH